MESVEFLCSEQKEDGLYVAFACTRRNGYYTLDPMGKFDLYPQNQITRSSTENHTYYLKHEAFHSITPQQNAPLVTMVLQGEHIQNDTIVFRPSQEAEEEVYRLLDPDELKNYLEKVRNLVCMPSYGMAN